MNYPVLPDKIYNILKWILIIVIPATEILLTVLTEAWGWNIPLESILKTIKGFQVFLIAIFGISTVTYKKNKEIK